LNQQHPPASPGLVHLALAMGGFAIGTAEFATMSLLPFMTKGLGIDEPTGGHLISVYALGVVVGAPLIAALGARVARRSLLLLMMALFALANGLSGLAADYETMLLLRFLSGLPHGAYFGVAALVAASLVPYEKRTQAVGRVMLGLTTATIVGVPVANWIGQVFGWRWGFGLVAAVAMLTVLLVWRVVPRQAPDRMASPLRELGALRNEQVWLTLGIGAIGFGGLFAVYTYLASTLMEVTGVSPAAVPLFLAIFGVGTTFGNLVMPRFADRALMPTAGALLLGSAAACAFYAVAAGNGWTIALAVFGVGVGGCLGTVLQTRLMDVAGDAQTLAAALNHSAFNAANALGPWLAGMAISAGHGWTSSGWVGCGLALGGFAILIVAVRRAGKPKLAYA
jgi:MFS transporter, DHA1 family, inner membrane transport protein